MRVKVLKELQYAPGQGNFAYTYNPGDVLDMSDGAARYFVLDEMAEETDDPISGGPNAVVATPDPAAEPKTPKKTAAGVKATDAAIKLAAEMDVSLEDVVATGNGGTVKTVADVRNTAAAGE